MARWMVLAVLIALASAKHQEASKSDHAIHSEGSKNLFRDLESLSASVEHLHQNHAKKHHLSRNTGNRTFEEGFFIFDWATSLFGSIHNFFGGSEPPKTPKTLEDRYPRFSSGELDGIQYIRRGKLWAFETPLTCSFVLIGDSFDQGSFFKLTAKTELSPTGFLVNPNTPVGFYDVTCGSNVQKLFVLFDPFELESLHYALPGGSAGIVDQNFLDEYVGATTGAVWQGSRISNGPRLWQYDQYSPNVIYSLYLMQKVYRFSWQSRQSPHTFAKHLSGLGNANSQGGVLTGNWGSNFAGGKPPNYWSGSGQIFSKFVDLNEDSTDELISVKYGQCWVFAGILTTMCRAFGIPARPVTNFESGHNSNIRDLSIDTFWTLKAATPGSSELEYNGALSDSVWNFHVWVEAMMKRDDLPAEYSGWQVVDATPQELAEDNGQMENGPAPVTAVQKMDQVLGSKLVFDINKVTIPPYDTAFVYGETSARRRNWVPKNFWKDTCTPHPSVPDFCLQSTKANVGYSTMTKKLGVMAGEDVIMNYKVTPAGFEEEEETDSISATLNCPTPEFQNGAPLICTATVKSTYTEIVTCQFHMDIAHDTYMHMSGTNLPLRESVVSESKVFDLAASESKVFELSVTADKYVTYWRQGRVLDVFAVVTAHSKSSKAIKDDSTSSLQRLSVSFPQLYVTVTCNKVKSHAECSARFQSPDGDTGGEFVIVGNDLELCPHHGNTCAGMNQQLQLPAVVSGADRTASFKVKNLEAPAETNVLTVMYISNEGITAQGSMMVKPAVTLLK